MRHFNIVTNCGCLGTGDDDSEEIAAMISSPADEEPVTNTTQERDLEAMLWVVNHNSKKPETDGATRS